jgi:DNA-binding NarL/FixJ family response regulator
MTEVFARTITVYLVDVHPIFREDLAHAIDRARNLVVVGQAGTAAGALAETRTAQPDVVLVDLDTPDRDGIELVGALRAELPAAKLLVLIPGDDEIRVAEAMRAGAHGYLLKTAEPQEVLESIRGIIAEEAPIPVSFADVVPRALRELVCASPVEQVWGVRKWNKRGPPPAPAAAPALVPGPSPPSLVDAVAEPDDEPTRPPRRR